MTDQKMNKQNEVNGGVNPVVVAAGAIVGVGIAVAGAILSDEKNREKIAHTASNVKDEISELVTKTQKQMETEKKAFEERIMADKIKVDKVVASAKDSVHKTTKEVNDAVKTL